MSAQSVSMMVPTAPVDPDIAGQIASDPHLFTFNGVNLRLIKDQEGNPWFKAKSVASALGYASPATAVRMHVPRDHKKKLGEILSNTDAANKGDREAWWLSEPGVYDLILACSTPLGDSFRKWLTEQVLPSIRRTGGYNQPAQQLEPYEQASQHLQLCIMEQQLHKETLQKRILAIEAAERAMKLAASARVPLTPSQTEAVQRLLNRALLPPEQLDEATITIPEFLKLKGHQWEIPSLQGPMGRLMKDIYKKAYGRDPPKIAGTNEGMGFDCNCYDRNKDMLLLEAAYRGLSLSENYARRVPLGVQIVNS